MICMEGEVEGNSWTDVPELERVCECEYPAHAACLRAWVEHTPACPICHECLLYTDPPRPTSRVARCVKKWCGSCWAKAARTN